jgi:hypothetical protein
MKHLSNLQSYRRADLISKYEAAHANLSHAVEVFNIQLGELREDLEIHIDAHTQSVEELNEFIEEVHDSLETYYNARSDKWRGESQGLEYLAWMEGWGGCADTFTPDLPGDLDEPELANLEELVDTLG